VHIHIFSQRKIVPIEKKVDFIEKYKGEHSLKILLWAVELSKSSYFEYINRKPSNSAIERESIKERIMEIWKQSDQIYGARKIKRELEKEKINLSEKTVGNYMKQMNIRSIYRTVYRPKRTSSNTDETLINHLANEQVIEAYKHIVTDITYIHTRRDGWVYQLTFLDAYTRAVLHSDVSNKMDDDFVSGNTKKLLKYHPGIHMIHSDRGSQYTSYRYKKLLEKNNVIASYSAKGYPYDNAIIESYHASIKRERLYRVIIEDLEHAKQLVFAYNFGFYNTRRTHQSLNYLTPNEFLKKSLLAA